MNPPIARRRLHLAVAAAALVAVAALWEAVDAWRASDQE